MSKTKLSTVIVEMAWKSGLTLGLAIGWFILAGFLFLDFLPQFKYYETVFVTNPGSTDNDVYFFWSWIPTLSILLVGMLWSGGILQIIWNGLSEMVN
jgi:hypothetical protein